MGLWLTSYDLSSYGGSSTAEARLETRKFNGLDLDIEAYIGALEAL